MRVMRGEVRGWVAAALACALLAGCKGKPQAYRTTVELTRVHAFGRDPREPAMMDVEFRYVECPGEVRRLVRGDRDFARCGLGLQVGQRVPVDVTRRYDDEKGVFRSEVTAIGPCSIVVDARDEANFEVVENCTELKATGAVVGVHCGRRRDKTLTDRCPWLLRN